MSASVMSAQYGSTAAQKRSGASPFPLQSTQTAHSIAEHFKEETFTIYICRLAYKIQPLHTQNLDLSTKFRLPSKIWRNKGFNMSPFLLKYSLLNQQQPPHMLSMYCMIYTPCYGGFTLTCVCWGEVQWLPLSDVSCSSWCVVGEVWAPGPSSVSWSWRTSDDLPHLHHSTFS